MRQSFSRNEAYWAVTTQALVAILVLPWVSAFWGLAAVGSCMAGSLICVLPTIYLYRRVFSHFGAHAAKKMFQSLYVGEAVKILLTGAGFAGAALVSWIVPLWLFFGFIGAQMAFWLAPIGKNILGKTQ